MRQLYLNQPEKIAPAFAEVQKIREQVEQAVKRAKKIALPRNQNKFKVFVKLDNRFHREIRGPGDCSKEKQDEGC